MIRTPLLRASAAGARTFARRLWYSIRFAGRPIHVHPTAYVSFRSVLRTSGGGSITIGPRCEIHPFAMVLTYGGAIRIGPDSSLNPFAIVYGHGGTEIGAGVRIAAHTVVIPANHLRGDDDQPGFQRGVRAQGIVIGDGTWIGAGCRILDGVRIGRHAVVGAGSVVVKSVPDHTTVAGVPARPLTASSSPR